MCTDFTYMCTDYTYRSKEEIRVLLVLIFQRRQLFSSYLVSINSYTRLTQKDETKDDLKLFKYDDSMGKFSVLL